MYSQIIEFIRDIYNTREFIPLHEPRFLGNEKKYLNECIDSTFVSSVGAFVDKFEKMVASYTGASHAVATVNGSAALHIALILSGIKVDDEVITQPLTFIATSNAIRYCGAHPVYVDVDKETLGLSPQGLFDFLKNETSQKSDGFVYNKSTQRRISACLPMHTLGHPCKILEIQEICNKFNIRLIEDAAESLGSTYKNRHTGRFGELGILSFNGNKAITTGGGGMIITDNESLARKAKHITTQGKLDHKWEYIHDIVAYNYRLPNINAALGCAQIEQLDGIIRAKRKLASEYSSFFKQLDNIQFVGEPEESCSNYWLNTILLNNKEERDKFLEFTNSNGIMTRPAWRLMNQLEMFNNCQCGDLSNSLFLQDRLVNIPSSVPKKHN